MATVYKFKAYYKTDGVGAVQDPAPTCTVINMADDSKLADAQATTASTNMPGLYTYSYSGADGLDCVAFFHTTDADADEADVASYVSDKITTNLNADVAGVETKVDTIDTNVDSILADTGTDGVVLANDAITAAKIAVDAIGADEIAAGAVTKIQNGLATPTNITAASGVTLAALQSGVTIPTVTTVTNAPTGMALEATLTAIKGAGWTNQTLEKIVADIAAIATGSGASVADILNALLASYTVSGSVGEGLGRLDNIQAKTDLITTGTTVTIASPVSGSTITAHRGDTLSAALENIGALTNNSKLWFTVKRDADDADSASIIQIEKTAGLLYINGATGTAANGSLTINDIPTGDVTIVLAAAETAKLSAGSYYYDVQILRSAGTPVSTLTSGTFIVTADVTRAVA